MRKNLEKRAQVQITETMLVMLVIVLIIAIGIFVYYKFSIKSVKERGVELGEEEATAILSSIVSMKEIKCNDEDCLDTLKILSIGDKLKEKLNGKRVIIEKIYPIVVGNERCDIRKFNSVEYPGNCKYYVINEESGNGFIISTPVSLFYPETGIYGIGRVVIEVIE